MRARHTCAFQLDLDGGSGTMTIVDGPDNDFMRLWSVFAELSEQLSQNRSLAVSLYGQVGSVKNQAVHSRTGFVLRRFNEDLSREAYETELEHMTNALTAENYALQHDNRQLNALIKEYEQTLETLMSAFRTRARDVQTHELKLIGEYESKLLAREESKAAQDLAASTAVSGSLGRISYLLRQVLRSVAGEDVEAVRGDGADQVEWSTAEAAEYALEREIELSRLEKENEMLRRMIGIDVSGSGGGSGGEPVQRASEPPKTVPRLARIPGGARGTVGPFGTYKVRNAG